MAQKRPYVLVVDDDVGIRRALTRLFERDGLDVHAVGSGSEALAAFADRAPDLAVVDVGLPDIDGLALCERIRAHPSGAELPLIVLTGQNDESTLARAFDAGASDFASKAEPLAALVQRARFLLRARNNTHALRESEARLREAQRLARLASWRWELASRALTGEAELWRVLGTPRGVLPHVAESERDELALRMRECLQSGRVVTGELPASGADGALRTLRYRMQLALDEHGEALALEGVVQDISAWRHSEQRAQFLAEHDALTGLPNRAGLLAELTRISATASGEAAEFGVVALSLESLGRVAETLGREAADLLLREAAKRLMAAADRAFLAHASEGQFTLVVQGLGGAAGLSAHAERVLVVLDAPIQLANHELMITAAAGVSRFPGDGEDAVAVLCSAERALAQARRGGPRVQTHSAATSEAALRRFALASRLAGAISRGELTLHYQPKIALGTGEIVGFEGLVRWHEPELGLLAPGEFIPIAEESGLIAPLSDWVVREACRQIAAWRTAGLGDVPIAVNLSAQQFQREGIAARIATILRECGADPKLLGIEVTESVLLADADLAIRELRALRELGIELALDDFGTGFSSLSYLRRLPVNIVKIDRAFISEIATREDAAALTASIVSMAKALWLRVVAEGVEKEAERELVAIWGCEEAQGYLFSRPVPADEAAELWRTRGPGTAVENPTG